MRRGVAHRGSGFTLIELMVTVALAAILAFVAVPSLNVFKRNAELTTATNALVSAIATARSEALKRNYNALVLAADGSRWESGWIVFIDRNFNNAFDAASETVIATQEPLPTYFKVTKTSSSASAFILFNASGYSKNSSGGFEAVTFTISRQDLTGDDELRQTRRIKVASTGRVRTCKPTIPRLVNDRDCSATAD